MPTYFPQVISRHLISFPFIFIVQDATFSLPSENFAVLTKFFFGVNSERRRNLQFCSRIFLREDSMWYVFSEKFNSAWNITNIYWMLKKRLELIILISQIMLYILVLFYIGLYWNRFVLFASVGISVVKNCTSGWYF